MSEIIRILYVDANTPDVELVRSSLEHHDTEFQLTQVKTGKEFESELASNNYDIVISDLQISGYEGFEILDFVKSRSPDLPVLIFTRTTSDKTAIEAIKGGAIDFVLKSPQSIKHLSLIISTALEKKKLQTAQEITVHTLRNSESHFRDIFEKASDGILLADIVSKKFILANPNLCRMLGYSNEEILKLTIADIHPKESLEHVISEFEHMVKEEISSSLNIPILRKDGSIFYADINSYPFYWKDKNCLIGFFRDITQRKIAEENLLENETKFRALTDTSVAAIVIYQDEKFVYVNPASEIITGYCISEVMDMNFWDLIPIDYRDLIHERGIARLQGKPVPSRYELPIVRKDGEIRWLDYNAGTIQYNGKIAAIGIGFDITERKRAEEELNESLKQMRQLSARLQSVRENESTRIAREIHDELGQTLTGIKMDISFLEDKLSEILNLRENPKLVEKINSISNQTDSAVQTVRKITTELRPVILDSMGLSAAIEWQTENFEQKTGIACSYFSPPEEFTISREASTALFRIMQEALTNVIRHAKASHVEVKLRRNDDKIFFEISDNGRGFNVIELNNLNSFGILGMKERTSLIGGSFEINSEPHNGTTIRITIPFHQQNTSSKTHD